MSSLLIKVKSKYSLKNIFDYLPYNLGLKLVYGSKKLMNNLDITPKVYQKFYEVKNILKPSIFIDKCLDYLNHNNNYVDNEKLIYGSLNSDNSTVDLIVENKGWEKVVKNVKNAKLLFTPNLIYYISQLNNEELQNTFGLLNLYKNNIVEIYFSSFQKECKINFEMIDQILNFLNMIFKSNNTNDNHNDKIPNYINNSHKIKKLSFEFNEILSYIDITNKFFDKIDEIFSLSYIKELFIDTNSFNDFQFTNFMKYASKKLISLKNIKINNFGDKISHYADISILCSQPNECIESIDLSNSFCSYDILPILNAKNYPLKSLKIKLYSNENKAKWLFLDYSFNTLETFELEVKEKNNHENIESIIKSLNKMKRLKHLKLIGGLSPNELLKLKNISNIEYMHIDINLLYNNIEVFPEDICNYFTAFEKMKSLTITYSDSLEISKITRKDSPIEFSFPPKLKILSLINFYDDIIISSLKKNKNILVNLEELKLENCHFIHEKFEIIVDLFSDLKNLLKLCINKLEFKISKKSLLEDITLYDYAPKIFKNVPTLLELDISNNKYDEKMLKSKSIEKISKLIPQKLFNLKIFSNEIPVSINTVNYLTRLFGNKLDLENNYPIISENIPVPDSDEENEYEDNYDDYDY